MYGYEHVRILQNRFSGLDRTLVYCRGGMEVGCFSWRGNRED